MNTVANEVIGTFNNGNAIKSDVNGYRTIAVKETGVFSDSISVLGQSLEAPEVFALLKCTGFDNEKKEFGFKNIKCVKIGIQPISGFEYSWNGILEIFGFTKENDLYIQWLQEPLKEVKSSELALGDTVDLVYEDITNGCTIDVKAKLVGVKEQLGKRIMWFQSIFDVLKVYYVSYHVNENLPKTPEAYVMRTLKSSSSSDVLDDDFSAYSLNNFDDYMKTVGFDTIPILRHN